MKYIIFSVIAVLSLHASAEIYKWVDENGRTHYGDSDSKPADAKVKTLDIKLNTYEQTSFESTEIYTEKVIMYSAQWCGYCKKARRYFTDNRIPFIEYDIDKDKSAKRRYQKLGATGVPVILYKDRRMNGFSESGFKTIYKNGA